MTEPTPQKASPQASPQERPKRGLRLALLASLMVNVLVIGVLAGGAVRMHGAEPPPQRQPDIRSLLRAMPDEARRALRQPMRDESDRTPRESREERRAQAAATNDRILQALRSEPFDQAAFVSLLQGDREAMQRRIDTANAAFARQLETLDSAERRAMADRLEEEWQDRRRR